LRRFAGHTDAVVARAFVPNGRQIVTTGAEGTARRWDRGYQATMRALCGRLVRDPTNDERVQYNITSQGPTCPQP
jgi:WD40 repeat protein